MIREFKTRRIFVVNIETIVNLLFANIEFVFGRLLWVPSQLEFFESSYNINNERNYKDRALVSSEAGMEQGGNENLDVEKTMLLERSVFIQLELH